jgi:hypothetical protein
MASTCTWHLPGAAPGTSKYFFANKAKHLGFGRYPEITLKIARDMRLEARRALELGNDPGANQEEERLARSATFKTVANEWMEIQRTKLAPRPLSASSSDSAPSYSPV